MNSLELAVCLLAFILLFVAAFLSLAETSLSRIDRFRATALEEEERRGSKALVSLVGSQEHFAGYLNSLLLLLLSVQIIAATSIAYLALHWFSGWAVFVVVVAEISVGYVLTEAMPKTWAVQHTEQAALFAAPLIAGLARVVPMQAITRALIWAANVLVPGKGLRQGPFVYEQQILALADRAATEQAIERDEHEMIHSVIEFGSKVSREVMVPRTDMFTIEGTCSAREAIDVALEKGFSRIPVRGDENDEIMGILFVKDLMQAIHDDHGHLVVSTMCRPAKFVPETKRVVKLMREMQAEKTHMSIVIDEHGNVVGLVTLEDLIEEVVGEISDEYDVDDRSPVEQIEPQLWRLDARMPIDKVYERISFRFPHGDWDTVGGLLINAFGRVPNKGESVLVDDYEITVDQRSGSRVTHVLVRIADQPVATAQAS